MAVPPPRTHGHHSTPRSPHQAASHAPPQLLQPRRRLRHPHHPLASVGHSTPPTPPTTSPAHPSHSHPSQVRHLPDTLLDTGRHRHPPCTWTPRSSPLPTQRRVCIHHPTLGPHEGGRPARSGGQDSGWDDAGTDPGCPRGWGRLASKFLEISRNSQPWADPRPPTTSLVFSPCLCGHFSLL